MLKTTLLLLILSTVPAALAAAANAPVPFPVRDLPDSGRQPVGRNKSSQFRQLDLLEAGENPCRNCADLFRPTYLASFPGTLAAAANAPDARLDPAVWRELEQAVFDQVNSLRTHPARYADQVLVPLKKTMVRYPDDVKLPFQGYKLIFDPAERDDHVLVTEGGREQTTAAVLDEAIAALRASPPLAALQRDPVLNKSARFNSQEFGTSDAQRTAHVDSLGRGPSARMAAFGLTRRMREDWTAFLAGLNDRSERIVRVYQEDATHFIVELPEGGGYKCRSVPESFAKFIAAHGQAVKIPELDQPGHQCLVRVDRKTRKLSCGAAAIDYPLRMPMTGENVVWGSWSRKSAARGLVSWWLLDPGLPGRSHRKILLDSDFRCGGVGCVWSAARGWVATFDASSEPWEETR